MPPERMFYFPLLPDIRIATESGLRWPARDMCPGRPVGVRIGTLAALCTDFFGRFGRSWPNLGEFSGDARNGTSVCHPGSYGFRCAKLQ